jgi:hypothetical protein
MTAFSPASAAFEGLRVLRRQPRAVAAWVGGNVLIVVLIALSKIGSGPVPVRSPAAATDLPQIVGRFGPLAFVAAPMLLILWIAIVGAIFRQELRPKESRWAFMRLGGDEVRLALVALIGAATVLVITGLEFGIITSLKVISDSVFPAAAAGIRVSGAAAAFFLNFWIVVRLSLAPAHTFAERRVSMFGSWSLTRRHFWDLAWMIFLMMVTVFLVFFVLALLANFLGGQSLKDLDSHHLIHPSWAAIVGLFVLILLFTVVQVLVSVLVYAPLAFAYRALAAPAES